MEVTENFVSTVAKHRNWEIGSSSMKPSSKKVSIFLEVFNVNCGRLWTLPK